jgi:hypothetical protein
MQCHCAHVWLLVVSSHFLHCHFLIRLLPLGTCRLWQMRMSMCETQHWKQARELWIFMQIQPSCYCYQNWKKDCSMITGEFVTGICPYKEVTTTFSYVLQLTHQCEECLCAFAWSGRICASRMPKCIWNWIKLGVSHRCFMFLAFVLSDLVMFRLCCYVLHSKTWY